MQEGLFGKYETAERRKCNELKYFSSANIYIWNKFVGQLKAVIVQEIFMYV